MRIDQGSRRGRPTRGRGCGMAATVPQEKGPEFLRPRDATAARVKRERVLGRQKTYEARFFRSISSQIIGVTMSCIAMGLLLPGKIMVFARDMKDCGNTDRR